MKKRRLQKKAEPASGSVTTSIAFKPAILAGLREQKDVHDRSVSWLVNKLVEEWLKNPVLPD